MATKIKAPQRYEVVGSFLRPEKLKQARVDFEAGKINAAELKAVEDEAIKDLVAKQKKAGLRLITDGEFRRATWHLDFMWGFEGVDHKPTTTGIPFHGEAAMIDDTFLTGKISVKEHPFVEHFKFVKALEDDTCSAKQTIPAPAQVLEQFVVLNELENTKKYYPNREELIEDVAKCYKEVISQLYVAGCRNLQLDDCSWGLCVDDIGPAVFGTDEEGMKEIQAQLLEANNKALTDLPEDLTVTTHVCRGNFNSTWACKGGYDKVASTLFAKENVDAFYLEFDDERSGGFEPLKSVPEGKKVVLGLITSKNPALENKQEIIDRIKKASEFVPLENLYLSPQCGFASCEVGNKLTEDEQWKKVALVKEIAETVWPDAN